MLYCRDDFITDENNIQGANGFRMQMKELSLDDRYIITLPGEYIILAIQPYKYFRIIFKMMVLTMLSKTSQ